MKQTINKEEIINYFGGDFKPFFTRYIPDLKSNGGTQYSSTCPLCDDKKPSFSVNTGMGVFNCRKCGRKGDIFTFYGEKHNIAIRGSGFVEICKGIADEFGINGQPRPQKRIVEKTYDYIDSKGQLVSQTIRYKNPKSFSQRRPDGKGGYVYDLQGITPVLYNLPKVLNSQEVIIVEGEKDADNLNALGFTATTSPMGANAWKDHYSDSLIGKDVILIPDNEDIGRQHMTRVAQSLQGKARSIKWIDLPDLPDKGDVSDFISKFDSREEASERLCNMFDGAEPYTPPKPKESRGFTLAELMKEFEQDKDIKFIWRNVIPKGQPIMFAGREGQGKTSILLQAAKEILREYKDGYVVWLACEGAAVDTIHKGALMGLDKHERFVIARKKDSSFKFIFDLERDRKELDEILSKILNPILVIIDSVRGITKHSENDDLVGKMMQVINDIICDKHRSALVYLDHYKKQESGKGKELNNVSGSTAKTAAVRLVMGVRKKSISTVQIKQIKTNFMGVEIPELESVLVGDKLHIRELTEQSNETKTDKCQIWLTNLLAKKKQMFAADIYDLGQKFEREEDKFSDAFIRKAKSKLPIGKRTKDGRSEWYWDIDVFP